MTAEQLTRQVSLLSAREKLVLIEQLLSELDKPDSAVDAAWGQEAEDRLAAYRRGDLKAIPLTEVLARYRN